MGKSFFFSTNFPSNGSKNTQNPTIAFSVRLSFCKKFFPSKPHGFIIKFFKEDFNWLPNKIKQSFKDFVIPMDVLKTLWPQLSALSPYMGEIQNKKWKAYIFFPNKKIKKIKNCEEGLCFLFFFSCFRPDLKDKVV